MGDFQAGDVVVCVDDAWLSPCPDAPRLREVFRVAEATFGRGSQTGLLGIYLYLVGKPAAWNAARFRKLNDGTDDAELIARIKRCKPARQPEPAL